MAECGLGWISVGAEGLGVRESMLLINLFAHIFPIQPRNGIDPRISKFVRINHQNGCETQNFAPWESRMRAVFDVANDGLRDAELVRDVCLSKFEGSAPLRKEAPQSFDLLHLIGIISIATFHVKASARLIFLTTT